MLLIDHYVGPSKIHGLGVFTNLFVPRGALVWQFNPVIDRRIHETALIDVPQHVVQLVRTHSEYFPKLGYYILGADGDYYMNHSDEPSLFDNRTTMLAARNLEPGDELTCDYRLVNVAAFNPDLAPKNARSLTYGQYQRPYPRRMPLLPNNQEAAE